MLIGNYYISADGKIRKSFEIDNERVEIGNCFETAEDTKNALEKLKAVKRLKDKGFKFEGYILESGHNKIIFDMFLENKEALEEAKPDLDLLFGGEE